MNCWVGWDHLISHTAQFICPNSYWIDEDFLFMVLSDPFSVVTPGLGFGGFRIFNKCDSTYRPNTIFLGSFFFIDLMQNTCWLIQADMRWPIHSFVMADTIQVAAFLYLSQTEYSAKKLVMEHNCTPVMVWNGVLLRNKCIFFFCLICLLIDCW